MRYLGGITIALLALSLSACNGDEGSERDVYDLGRVESDSGSGESDADTEDDSGTEPIDDMGTQPDGGSTAELCDLAVANPGPMNGTWELVTVPSGTKWFDLRICHDLDDTDMDGSAFSGDYTEASTGITGGLQTPQFAEDPLRFGVNWFVNEDGEEYQFNFSQGTSDDGAVFTGRFQNGRLMETGDAELRKVE